MHICGYVYDEEKEGKPFYELTGWPVCKQPPERFKVMETEKSTSVPTIYALYRARKYLDSIASDIDLVITGGLRVSSDFAKAIAMGADAVAIASAAMVAAACQQYRICGTGMCPVGVATQDEKLSSAEELRTFARITGNEDIHNLSVDDLCTINREISEYTNIAHA